MGTMLPPIGGQKAGGPANLTKQLEDVRARLHAAGFKNSDSLPGVTDEPASPLNLNGPATRKRAMTPGFGGNSFLAKPSFLDKRRQS